MTALIIRIITKNYKTILKKYPKSIIKNQTKPKNIKSNWIFITFLSIKNSGSESPTTAIIKARPVQSGIHFEISASTIGIILVALAYIGIPIITAIGTAKGLSAVMYFSKNPVGTNQWIMAQSQTHKST